MDASEQGARAMKTARTLLLFVALGTVPSEASTTMIFDATARHIAGHSQVWGLGSQNNPELIWNSPLPTASAMTHPFHHFFTGFYSRLATMDAFDSTLGGNTGDELAQGAIPGYFGATISGGHAFQTLGVTSTNANAVHLSMNGFFMDTGAASDFYFDSGTGIEHRIYRGGNLGFFEEMNPTTFTKVLAYQDVALHFTIDYLNSTIGVELLSATPNGGGGLPTLALTQLSSSSFDPVIVSGNTTAGPFGRYAADELELTFSSVPEPSRALLGLIGCLSVTMRRRRAQ